MTPAWDDVAYVRAEVVDKKGVVNPNATDKVTFKVEGPGVCMPWIMRIWIVMRRFEGMSGRRTGGVRGGDQGDGGGEDYGFCYGGGVGWGVGEFGGGGEVVDPHFGGE